MPVWREQPESESGVLNAQDEEVVLALEGRRGVLCHLEDPEFSWSGTIQIHVSFDGSEWTPTWMIPLLSQDAVYEVQFGILSNFYTVLVPPGATHVKLLVSAYSAGSVTATLTATYEPAGVSSVLALEQSNQMSGTYNVERVVKGQQAVQNAASTASTPVMSGHERRSTNPTAYTDGQVGRNTADLLGRLLVLPYSVPELALRGNTADITGNSNTQIIAAQGAGKRIYLTSIAVRNSHASVGTWINVKDGTTTIWTDYAGPNGGGFAYEFPVPLRLTANAALQVACETSGANVRASAAGFQSV